MNELHHQEARVATHLEAVESRDVGMIQGGEKAGLPLETRQKLLAVGQRARQNFDRYLPAERGITGPIHLTHAPLAEKRQDLVST